MKIETYKLANKSGMAVTVTNLGCAIIKLEVPDKNNKPCDVVLGLDCAEDYATKAHPFFGVVAGRVANRIGYGKFTLNGKEYQLETNNDEHHLHGGNCGFDKKIWSVCEATDTKIVFSYNSPDGEGNYPGNLNATVTYSLSTTTNALRIDYHATTDTQTICNLTNHSYFNLSGYNSPNIYDNVLQIASDKITAVDAGLIPTGEFIDIKGTAFDFNTPKAIGQDIEEAGKLNNTSGYDHNFVLTSKNAACAYSPQTGIRMKVDTNSPGMQLYTSNMIPAGVMGKGITYGMHSGFCLETQLFPNAINISHFPSSIVEKNKAQEFFTQFTFGL